jgi:hypothetical protein
MPLQSFDSSAWFDNCISLIVLKESRLLELKHNLIRKDAILLQQNLPQLDFCLLKSPPIEFVRLSDPKTGGLSLRKKQCDLWEFCWGSSHLLAFLVSQALFSTWLPAQQARCLEIGGGLGITTLSLAYVHFTQLDKVWMTDLVQDALTLFQFSVKLLPRECQRCVHTQVLNWNVEEDYAHLCGQMDLVLGADVLFMSWCAPMVANVVTSCVSPLGLIVLVDPFRLNDELFVEHLALLGVRKVDILVFPTKLVESVVPIDSHNVPVKKAKLIIASKGRDIEPLVGQLIREFQFTREVV